MILTTAFVLLSAVSSTLAVSPLLAARIAQPLSARAVNAAGGWALSQATCPRDTSGCWNGCCPSSLSCVNAYGNGIISVCCPGTTQCTIPLISAPFCADNSWSLWVAGELEVTKNRKAGYFCCLPGQVGLQTGDCVASNAVVAASLSASLVSPDSSTAIAASSSSSSATSAVTTVASTSVPGRATDTSGSSPVPNTVTSTSTTTGGTTISGSSSPGETGGTTISGSSRPGETGGTATTANSSLSTGAIIGVAVGAVVILIVALLALWRWHTTRKAKNNLAAEAHAFNSANQGPLAGNAPVYSGASTPYLNPVREYKTPAVGVHGYGGTPPPQQGLSPPPPQQQYSGPSPVEAPQAWERRIEIGQGRE